ncbi:MAG: hypothetical protein ACMUIP_00140 [bacterium]
MKQYAKILFWSCCFLLIFVFVAFKAYAYDPAPTEVVFGLRAEDITTQAGPCRRVYFNINKGSAAEPVSVSVTMKIDTSVYGPVTEQAISASPNLTNKTITSALDVTRPDLVRVMVGLENYNNTIISQGDVFYIDLTLLPNANPGDDSVYLSGNYVDDGPNQASTSDGSELTIISETGMTFSSGSSVATVNESSGASPRSCFINTLVKD